MNSHNNSDLYNSESFFDWANWKTKRAKTTKRNGLYPLITQEKWNGLGCNKSRTAGMILFQRDPPETVILRNCMYTII